MSEGLPCLARTVICLQRFQYRSRIVAEDQRASPYHLSNARSAGEPDGTVSTAATSVDRAAERNCEEAGRCSTSGVGAGMPAVERVNRWVAIRPLLPGSMLRAA